MDKRNTEKVDEASLGEQYIQFPKSDHSFCQGIWRDMEIRKNR